MQPLKNRLAVVSPRGTNRLRHFLQNKRLRGGCEATAVCRQVNQDRFHIYRQEGTLTTNARFTVGYLGTAYPLWNVHQSERNQSPAPMLAEAVFLASSLCEPRDVKSEELRRAYGAFDFDGEKYCVHSLTVSFWPPEQGPCPVGLKGILKAGFPREEIYFSTPEESLPTRLAQRSAYGGRRKSCIFFGNRIRFVSYPVWLFLRSLFWKGSW